VTYNKVVLSLQISFKLFNIVSSVSVSTADKQSSKVKSVDFNYRSGDRHSCFCPPESVIFLLKRSRIVS
jgi:hypothetical protein